MSHVTEIILIHLNSTANHSIVHVTIAVFPGPPIRRSQQYRITSRISQNPQLKPQPVGRIISPSASAIIIPGIAYTPVSTPGYPGADTTYWRVV